MYHNGILTNSEFSENTADLVPNVNKALVFGRGDITRDRGYCNCEIDEVQIFEVVLNAEEVSQLFHQQ